MRVLIAPNAFKGCLSAFAAARAMAAGVRRARPRATIDLMPISDGGDGLMEVLLRRFGGRRIYRMVQGPLGERRRACYAMIGRATAVVEMAQASGIAGLPKDLLDPLGASSWGTGELIADALRRGARRVVLGLGGSASSDGGAGLAAALGAELLGEGGRRLPAGAAALLRLDRVDASRLRSFLRGVRVIGISDVRNPLTGPDGSARVYGPQKGAGPREVAVLEKALSRYARVLRRDLGVDVRRMPGAGAAGGAGAGLAAFCGAPLLDGAPWVLRRLGAARRIAASDLVLTGEGRLDRQSFFGKAPVALAARARNRCIPVGFICGSAEPRAARRLERDYGAAVFNLSADGRPEAAMAQARGRLRRAARTAASSLAALLAALLPFPGAAQPSSTEMITRADKLYFERNRPGRLREAEVLLRASLKQDEADPEALWRLGRCLLRRSEGEPSKEMKLSAIREAERALEQSVLLDPKSAPAHCWLAIAYGRRGEVQGLFKSLFLVDPIRRELRQAIALDPAYAPAYHVLGEMLWQLPRMAGGSKREAIKHLEKSIELRPTHTAAYPPLAEFYMAMGEREKAKALLERLFAVSRPDDPAEAGDHLKDASALLQKLR